jgi:hypothetical protein
MTTEQANSTAPALEPTYAFDQRLQRELAAAQAVADAAAAEERAAFAEVDRVRGDHAIGLVERGRLLVASRRLAKAQEASATASSALRATERDHARRRDERRRQENAIERHRAAELRAIADVSRVRRRECWVEINELLREIDALPGLPPLSESVLYRQALDMLSRVQRAFNN